MQLHKASPEKTGRIAHQQCGVECFLTLLEESKIIRRTRKRVINPIFPWISLRTIPVRKALPGCDATGVRKVVELSSGPVELDAGIIDAIKERLNDGYVTPQSERFKMGQIVHIKGGPHTGLEAVFMREMTDRNRVLLLLNTLGLHAKLTMNIDQVSLSKAL